VVYSIESVITTFFTNFFTPPLQGIEVPLGLLFLSLQVGLVSAQVYRYRYVSTLLQRQQTKWVVYGFTANIVVTVLVFLPMFIFPRSLFALISPLVFVCASLLFPFTIGIAMFRYRLWDIDLLINRTLVYGTLTVTLALVYFGLVLSLESLVHLVTGTISEQPLILVASTLVIAALFQPLRRRIQTIIDRRFYRRKYDAQKTLAAFSTVLRGEVDLDQLREQLLAVVEETMQPAHLSLWIRPLKMQASGEMRGESASPVEEGPDVD
jgi:hypothetical protein